MILSLIEHEDGTPSDVSLQMLTLARDIAEQTDSSLAAIVFGDGDAVTDAVATQGVEDVYSVTHDRLDVYAPEAWAESVDQLVEELDPEAVLAAGTDRGHEVLAHVVARRDLPMAANCTEVDVGDAYEVTRQRWGGSLIEHARFESGMPVLTTAAHEIAAEPATEAADVTTHDFTPTLDDDDFRVRVSRREESDAEGIPLGEARIVVGGGRGVGSSEDFDQLEELAELLGGTVGSSRAAVNEGWRPHDDQIGLTGAKIAPKLYVACGISGAVQHMVGCKGADNILAINTDPETSIIQKGEYAVIGDLHEVVPALNEAIRNGQ
ncbi:electron transfer flavoprotein subunit alpha/FixB family protein [Halocatena marina]|uniref:electron transfer flavoprotein subunit alpha/FixB family protein n=1 Tax=Halocatena marina TaxID=2934937 RepID=UPI0022250669|nr:electron transfer flavoprotein subunit alpha/FixB family protein [Halocatena marina]